MNNCFSVITHQNLYNLLISTALYKNFLTIDNANLLKTKADIEKINYMEQYKDLFADLLKMYIPLNSEPILFDPVQPAKDMPHID